MIEQYRGYWVSGSSAADYNQTSSHALGSICAPKRDGSITEIKRIEGPMFKTWAEAEEHGLVLGKTWLDGLAESFELWITTVSRTSGHSFLGV